MEAKPVKTAKISLDTIKCTDGWFELANELGMTEEQTYKVFEYGEYGNNEIVVDENLNIVGGRVIPCGK